jgi:hypothetical protein
MRKLLIIPSVFYPLLLVSTSSHHTIHQCHVAVLMTVLDGYNGDRLCSIINGWCLWYHHRIIFPRGITNTLYSQRQLHCLHGIVMQ